MALNQNLAPLVWTPSTTAKMLNYGIMRAGDWVCVKINYPSTNPPGALLVAPGQFIFHVIFEPNQDDATPHPDQATRYGGSASNRRTAYRIDPHVWFQVPCNGQLSIIAGGDSPTASVEVIVDKIFTPYVPIDREALHLGIFGPHADMAQTPRLWAPPVVGQPCPLVPSTWINVVAGTNITFPDGAVKIEVVDDTGTPGNPVALTIATMGLALRINCASGIPRSLGALACGNQGNNGTPATWTPTGGLTLRSVTVWSALGG